MRISALHLYKMDRLQFLLPVRRRQKGYWIKRIASIIIIILLLYLQQVTAPVNALHLPRRKWTWCSFCRLYSEFWKVTWSLDSLKRELQVSSSSLRAKSARAVTGRRRPHSGRGEDFLSRQPDFFTETAVTPERKVEKLFPMWEINRHAEG